MNALHRFPTMNDVVYAKCDAVHFFWFYPVYPIECGPSYLAAVSEEHTKTWWKVIFISRHATYEIYWPVPVPYSCDTPCACSERREREVNKKATAMDMTFACCVTSPSNERRLKKWKNWTRGGYWTTVTSTFRCNEAPVSRIFFSLFSRDGTSLRFHKNTWTWNGDTETAFSSVLAWPLHNNALCFNPFPRLGTQMQKSGVYIHHLPPLLKKKNCALPSIFYSQHITLSRA